MVTAMSKPKVKIIIGSNYGDECKGLVTHYFAQKYNKENRSCLNVLFNGGCQRGHTVELKNGVRHVFHHFGSGTYDNADTYFDKDFMVNPMIFVEEKQQLHNIKSKCYISPACRVTTPYDMFINQIVETHRADNRHGSCGYGIWETQKRYENDEYSLRYSRLYEKTDKEIYYYLCDIAYKYLPKRLADYRIKNIPEEWQSLIYSKNLKMHYISDLRQMQKDVEQIPFDELCCRYDAIIFEGGQGLALDEDNKEAYPHVTASKTSSFVPIKRIRIHDVDIEICYVTRSYFTRHGSGAFPTECDKEEINSHIEDKTNETNEFQGSIRYGKFDINEILDRVQKDINYAKSIIPNLKTSLFVSHLNYTGDIVGNCTIEELKQHFNKMYMSNTKFSENVIYTNKQERS